MSAWSLNGRLKCFVHFFSPYTEEAVAGTGSLLCEQSLDTVHKKPQLVNDAAPWIDAALNKADYFQPTEGVRSGKRKLVD